VIFVMAVTCRAVISDALSLILAGGRIRSANLGTQEVEATLLLARRCNGCAGRRSGRGDPLGNTAAQPMRRRRLRQLHNLARGEAGFVRCPR
jgi:hypothetical protein